MDLLRMIIPVVILQSTLTTSIESASSEWVTIGRYSFYFSTTYANYSEAADHCWSLGGSLLKTLDDLNDDEYHNIKERVVHREYWMSMVSTTHGHTPSSGPTQENGSSRCICPLLTVQNIDRNPYNDLVPRPFLCNESALFICQEGEGIDGSYLMEPYSELYTPNHYYYLSRHPENLGNAQEICKCQGATLLTNWEGLHFFNRTKLSNSMSTDLPTFWTARSGMDDCSVLTKLAFTEDTDKTKLFRFICEIDYEYDEHMQGNCPNRQYMLDPSSNRCFYFSTWNINYTSSVKQCNDMGGYLLHWYDDYIYPYTRQFIYSHMSVHVVYWLANGDDVENPQNPYTLEKLDSPAVQNFPCDAYQPYVCQRTNHYTGKPATTPATDIGTAFPPHPMSTMQTPLSTMDTTTRNESLPSGWHSGNATPNGVYIGGGIAGCVILLLLTAAAVIVFIRRKRKSQHKNNQNAVFENVSHQEKDHVKGATGTSNSQSNVNTPDYAEGSSQHARIPKMQEGHGYEDTLSTTARPHNLVMNNENTNYSEIQRVSTGDAGGLLISENGLYSGSGTHTFDNNAANNGSDDYEMVMKDNDLYSEANASHPGRGFPYKGGEHGNENDVVMKENDLYAD